MARKISYEQIMSVQGLSSRDAAKSLKAAYGIEVGKSTITDARRDLREGTFEQELPDGSRVIELNGDKVPTTEEEIEAIYERYGVAGERFEKNIRFGLWNSADGSVKNSFRATVTPKRGVHETVDSVDPLSILAALRADSYSNNGPYAIGSGEGAFVFSLNDTQFGKIEEGGGGTPATLARIESAIDTSINRVANLRAIGYSLGTLVLIGGGDIVEGCTIYPNQSFNLDLDRRGQINAAVATICNILDRLGSFFDNIIVLAAKGNHGEHRINGKRVNARDNDDVLVFEMAKVAYDREAAVDGSIGSRISWVIANDDIGVTANVAGWTLGTTHGDELGTGRFPFQKVLESMKRWALGRLPLGKSDVLITHHYHNAQGADFGGWEWHQTRAQDDGSRWFEQVTGQYSAPGTLTFVMTPDLRYGEEKYV